MQTQQIEAPKPAQPVSGIPIRVAHTVSPYALACALVAGFEGGSDYWMEGREYQMPTKTDNLYRFPDDEHVYPYVAYPLSEDGAVIVITDDKLGPCNTTRHPLNREALTRGLNALATQYPETFMLLTDEDTLGDFDADDADLLIQLCLFGTQVFG